MNLGKHAERPDLRGKNIRVRHRLYKDSHACRRFAIAPTFHLESGLTCVRLEFAKNDEETEVEFQDWEGCCWSSVAKIATVHARRTASACRLLVGLCKVCAVKMG